MPIPRTPLLVAVANGRVQHDPQRYKTHAAPVVANLGSPTSEMTPAEAAWFEHYRTHAYWLTESDRSILTQFCKLSAKMMEKGLSDTQTTALVKLSSVLGLNPCDRSRVQLPEISSRDDMF